MSRLIATALVALLAVACSGEQITPVATPTQPAFPGTPGLPGQPTQQPGTSPQPGTPTQPPTSDLGRLIAGTVQVDIYEARQNGPTFVGHGSGTIISPDGLILTNAHVAAQHAPGLAVQYGAIGGMGDPPVELHILITEREDAPPVPRYKAQVVTVDGYLDVAVLRITSTIDDQPVGQLNLPAVPVGDSDALRIGDPLTVVGFPGIGGDTVSFSNGDVSGFLDDAKVGNRGWIKTSAIIYGGNSGGLAANAAGELVGLPTRAPDTKNPNDIGGYELVRPVNLAKPVIDAAINGQPYTESPYVEAGSGQEQLQFVGWLPESATTCDPSQAIGTYPTGTATLRAAFRWSGFTDGEDYAVLWLGQPEGATQIQRIHNRTSVWDFGPSGECVSFSLSMRSAFPDGVYGLLVGVGPTLAMLGTGETTVGGSGGPGLPGIPTPGPATPGPATPGPATPAPGTPAPTLPTDPDQWVGLGGRVIDATTGRPVQGAIVLIFLPGVDPIAWLNDPNASDSDVLANGTSDAEGVYIMNFLVPAQMELPILVVARGYVSWSGILTTGTQDGFISDIAITPSTP